MKYTHHYDSVCTDYSFRTHRTLPCPLHHLSSLLLRVVLWGHLHIIPPLHIQSHFTSQLSFLCPYTNQHTDLFNSSFTTNSKALSQSCLLCLYLGQSKRPLTSRATLRQHAMHPRPHLSTRISGPRPTISCGRTPLATP